MNLCFLTGKIIGDIKYEFIWNSKNISIAIFKLKVEEKCILTVKAYDEIADWCYQKLIKGDTIIMQGQLDNKIEVIVKDVILF